MTRIDKALMAVLAVSVLAIVVSALARHGRYEPWELACWCAGVALLEYARQLRAGRQAMTPVRAAPCGRTDPHPAHGTFGEFACGGLP